MNEIHLNTNETVRVRLNDHGKLIHKKRYEKRYAGLFPYSPPTEDGDGFSEWTLWDLMALFGPHHGLGMKAPFENNEIVFTVPLEPKRE